MAFLKCQFCGALYVHKGFRVPSGACDACWLEINSQAFKRRNKEKGEPVSTEPRTYEVGYLCENCLHPLEDTRPGVEDFRVAVGRTKRLCRKCAAIEDCPNASAEGHSSLGGCWLCNPDPDHSCCFHEGTEGDDNRTVMECCMCREDPCDRVLESRRWRDTN